MIALVAVISRASAVLPLTLLALALGFVVIVAVIRPTPERQAMVDRLGCAIKDLGAVISGTPIGGPCSGLADINRADRRNEESPGADGSQA